MMKQLITLAIPVLLLVLTSCSTEDAFPTFPPTEQPGQSTEPDDSDNNHNNPPNDDTPMSNELKITIGSASFNATFENNATATAFKALLPLTVNMSELNGNEKYINLSSDLPTAPLRPGMIRAGDLMLYGSTTLVFFYESFSSSYSYTRVGRITNPEGLATILGTGNVRVTFKLP